MRKVYKSIKEVKAAFPNAKKIHEYESIFIVEDEKTVNILRKALSKEKVYDKMIENGFPPKYLKTVFNGLKETEALRRIREVRKKCAILDGKPGVGKSIASVWRIAKDVQFLKILRPLYISCVSFPDLASLYSTYRQHDAYMIDDLIATLPQPRLELIIEIIYYAELERKWLFITSNGFLNVAKSSFPEAILSRLKGYCEYIAIKENRDLRLQNTS